MNTVDDLLKLIVDTHLESVEDLLADRDIKALKNIARLVDSTQYITENQAKLAVKILKENVSAFEKFQDKVEQITDTLGWARTFRVIKQLRKIYVNNNYDLPQIAIEITYSAELQKEFSKFPKTIEGFCNSGNNKTFFAALTEKNIVELVDKLKKFKFEISEELVNYYNTIKSWSKTDLENQYRITTISHPNFEKQIISDLGINTSIDQSIILDRSMRYQYFVENTEKLPENLTNSIAARTSTKVWIDKNLFSLEDIFKSLNDLRRFPALVVLDSRDEAKCLQDLKNLSEILENYGIFDGVGVYFRLDNSKEGKEFNQLIAEKKYNCHLDASTKIVVVQSGKIPKFLLKTDWKPMSVISINHPLRHSKTAVYANVCDLILTYTDSKPMIETRHPWE